MRKFDSLTIEGFRAFRELKLENLGRVNLITGRNNTGKSSVLEALRILASGASPYVLGSILHFREENLGDGDERPRLVDSESIFLWSSLFNGFPKLSSDLKPLVITAKAGKQAFKVTIRAFLRDVEKTLGSRRISSAQQDIFYTDENSPLQLLVEANGIPSILSDDYIRRYPYRNRLLSHGPIERPNIPCTFVSAYGGERTATLGPLWDEVALSDYEDDVVSTLRIVDPNILAVSMVGGEGRRDTRTAIVRSKILPRPVPLRSFGDGMNRLFGIVLSLVNSKGGLLLIDEFENGMHHTIQVNAWNAIFQLATKLKIQVVATSHSWDAIEAFQKAASISEEDGVLIRLSRNGEDVVPTVFREKELAIVTRDKIEVR